MPAPAPSFLRLCFKHFGAYCIIGTMPGALAADAAQLGGQMAAFLNFCRIEKGLSANTLSAYTADLERFTAFQEGTGEIPASDGLAGYFDHLYQSGLSSRSIARHLTTLRNFFGFLLAEGRIAADPTEHLRALKQWQNI